MGNQTMRKVHKEAEKLYDIFNDLAFSRGRRYNLNTLTQTILKDVSEDYAGKWAWESFELWQEKHAELQGRFNSHGLPTSVSLDFSQIGQVDNVATSTVDASSAASASDGGLQSAACPASAEVETPAQLTRNSAVDGASKPIWNFLIHFVKTFIPGLEQLSKPIAVQFKKGMKDLLALSPGAHNSFLEALAQESPQGQRLGGHVLDLIVNYKK